MKELELDKKHIALLGTMRDKDIADLLGVGKSSIWRLRNKLGIAPYGTSNPEWTAEMDAQLGKSPDTVLAEKWGKSANAVRRRRCALDICSSAERKGLLQDKLMASPKFISLAGKMPDHQVAMRVGASKATVTKVRDLMGIAPYNSNNRKSEVTNEDDSVYGGRLSRSATRVCKLMQKWR